MEEYCDRRNKLVMRDIRSYDPSFGKLVKSHRDNRLRSFE